MGLVERFDPPAFLSDYDNIPGQREAWHKFISECFRASINAQNGLVLASGGGPGTVQYYNPAEYDPGGVLVQQPIVWNAFPKELLRCFGRTRALREADRLWPLNAYRARLPRTTPEGPGPFYRPQTEYCEWHVKRAGDSQKICRVTFTSEPPEYWQGLFGGSVDVDTDQGIAVLFPGDKQRLLDLYRELVSAEVELEDLICHEDIILADGSTYLAKGQYNPLNKWNTTDGIAHLCAPPNSISAEVRLGADATILRNSRRGQAVVEPEALICCAAYGGPDRNSDPTIGAAVNALARLGAMVTLPNPVGLYMDHIDLSGWTAPPGVEVGECVRIVRGSVQMVERLVVEVPPESGYTVSDLKIGGETIEYGAQIAECITVKLVGAAAKIGAVKNDPINCVARCCIDTNDPAFLDRAVGLSKPTPPGMKDAFSDRAAAPAMGVSLVQTTKSTRYAHAYHGRAK